MTRKNKIWAIALSIFVPLIVAGIVLFVLFFMPIESPVHKSINIEVGTKSVSSEIFKIEPDSKVEILTDLDKIDITQVSKHKVQFRYRRRYFTSVLNIIDTTAPVAKAVDKEIYNDESLKSTDFVTDIKDCSDVVVEFVNQPDFTKEGEQKVEISLTDTYGNKSVISAKLKVKKDTTAPVFKGMGKLTVRVGKSLSYKKGVTATDDRDGKVSYTVDSSDVDLQKEGKYTIVYTAKDSSGNTTVAKRKLTVLPKLVINRALVDRMAKKVLKKIVKPNMDSHQKVKAVYNWVRNNMVYSSSGETDIPNAAYVAFEKKRGDCYNYYAVTKVLLDNCGIKNKKVTRKGGSTSHYWLLVNAGTGWYHYDTTPQSKYDPFTCFMKTDEEVWEYAKGRSDKRTDYYDFDTSKYPKRATKKYKY